MACYKAENEATRPGAIREIFDRAVVADHKVVVVFKETESGADNGRPHTHGVFYAGI